MLAPFDVKGIKKRGALVMRHGKMPVALLGPLTFKFRSLRATARSRAAA